jgi:hypothetical protein
MVFGEVMPLDAVMPPQPRGPDLAAVYAAEALDFSFSGSSAHTTAMVSAMPDCTAIDAYWIIWAAVDPNPCMAVSSLRSTRPRAPCRSIPTPALIPPETMRPSISPGSRPASAAARRTAWAANCRAVLP